MTKVRYPVRYSKDDPILGYTDSSATAIKWLADCCRDIELVLEVELKDETWVVKSTIELEDMSVTDEERAKLLIQANQIQASRLPGRKPRGRQVRFTYSLITDDEFVYLMDYCRTHHQTISWVVSQAVSGFLKEAQSAENLQQSPAYDLPQQKPQIR